MKDLHTKSFAALVETERKKRNLSQDDLAKELGVSRVTISRLEHGEHSPSLQKAIEIAQFLDLSLDSLYLSKRGSIESFVEENFSDRKKSILEYVNKIKEESENA